MIRFVWQPGLSRFLNKPPADLEGFLHEQLVGGGARLESHPHTSLDPRTARVLVVDDSIQTGREVARTRELLAQAGLAANVKFLCVFADPKSVSKVDFYGEVCPMPRAFKWNIMHHPHLEYSCVDIDGVPCRRVSGWDFHRVKSPPRSHFSGRKRMALGSRGRDRRTSPEPGL